MARQTKISAALRLQQLAQAIARVDPQAGWEELRDVLWLAQHLPPAAVPVASAIETQTTGRDDTGARIHSEVDPPTPGPTIGSAAYQQTSRPVEVDESAAPDVDPQADSAVYASAGVNGPGGLRAIPLPSPHPLPEAAELARALRPLRRRHARGAPRILDEEASAEAMAHTGLPQPVLRPPRQRWFDAVVVVDTHLPLLAWRPRVDEFVSLLRRRAGLRDLHLFSLHALPHGLALHAPDGRPANPAAWQHSQGGRLLLVVSDATGPAWHDGRIARWLFPWACLMPVAVAQLLPEPLWQHSGLGIVDLRVQAHRRDQPTATLAVQRPEWAEGEPGLVLPVLDMAPTGARRWARMLMAAGGATCPAALLPYEGSNITTARVPEPGAQLVALRRGARPRALKLAAALAAIKPLTLPVVRLVQASLPPVPAGDDDLAQVLASGLLTPRGPAPSDTALNLRADEQVTLDMADSVRDDLVGGLLRSEWWELNLAVQRYVEQASGNPFDFIAYLEDRQGSRALTPAALPFARFARRLADRFRPPGAAGAAMGRRVVHENIAGPGLTVRAEVALPAPTQTLRWSADGRRLGVLHSLGLDIYEAPRLHHAMRLRRGGWVLHVLCPAADADPVRELVTSVARQLEQRTGRPVGVRVLSMPSNEPGRWKVRMLAVMSTRSDAAERAGDRPVILFAMTRSVAKPGTREHEAWWQELQRLKGVRVLAMTEDFAGLGADSDLWLNAFEQGAASPALAAAVEALQRSLPPTDEAGLGVMETFAFADKAGHDLLTTHRAGNGWALLLHQPLPDGNVDELEFGPGKVEGPAVKAIYLADGALYTLLEGDQGMKWRTGADGIEVTNHPLLGLTQAGRWLVSLRPGLDIESTISQNLQLFEGAVA